MKIKSKTIQKAFAGKCPVTDAVCLNPMCVFGCMEKD